MQRAPCEWLIEPFGDMRVPAVIFADEALISEMDDKVFEQVTNVSTLPGIVKASFAMPDAQKCMDCRGDGHLVTNPDGEQIVLCTDCGACEECFEKMKSGSRRCLACTDKINAIREKLSPWHFQRWHAH